VAFDTQLASRVLSAFDDWHDGLFDARIDVHDGYDGLPHGIAFMMNTDDGYAWELVLNIHCWFFWEG